LLTTSIIFQWLNIYKYYSFEGLEIKGKKRTYSREFKPTAVEFYLIKELSCQEITNQLYIVTLIHQGYLHLEHSCTINMARTLLSIYGKLKKIKLVHKEQANKIENQRIRTLEIELRKAQQIRHNLNIMRMTTGSIKLVLNCFQILTLVK